MESEHSSVGERNGFLRLNFQSQLEAGMSMIPSIESVSDKCAFCETIFDFKQTDLRGPVADARNLKR